MDEDPTGGEVSGVLVGGVEDKLQEGGVGGGVLGACIAGAGGADAWMVGGTSGCIGS